MVEPAAREPRLGAVTIAGVVKRFGAHTALGGIELEVRSGELFSLLGPSGCGKTTLLRLIAGLETPDAGRITIGGDDMTEVPAHRRPVNTVFQSYALFPHLDVADNVAFGLKMKGVARRERATRVAAALELVDIGALATRRPQQLSGGQRQRVALARAIVNEPRVLLLDEPMGALDLKLRLELQSELKALQRRIGMTFIHVTHDQDEALAISDRIAVMHAGRLEQVGTPEDLYERPATPFVATFVGRTNLGLATVTEPLRVSTPWGELELDLPLQVGTTSFVAIRPEDVVLEPHVSESGRNQISGSVLERRYSGAHTLTRVGLPGGEVWVSTTRGAASTGDRLVPGDLAWVTLPAARLRFLEWSEERARALAASPTASTVP